MILGRPAESCGARRQGTKVDRESWNAQGLMRVRSPSYGGCWVPVFDTATVRKSDETYWPVGLTAHDLRCIVCNPTNPVPQVVRFAPFILCCLCYSALGL